MTPSDHGGCDATAVGQSGRRCARPDFLDVVSLSSLIGQALEGSVCAVRSGGRLSTLITDPPDLRWTLTRSMESGWDLRKSVQRDSVLEDLDRRKPRSSPPLAEYVLRYLVVRTKDQIRTASVSRLQDGCSAN
jgi:hypothetical protein